MNSRLALAAGAAPYENYESRQPCEEHRKRSGIGNGDGVGNKRVNPPNVDAKDTDNLTSVVDAEYLRKPRAERVYQGEAAVVVNEALVTTVDNGISDNLPSIIDTRCLRASSARHIDCGERAVIV